MSADEAAIWIAGQREWEAWSEGWFRANEDQPGHMEAVDAEVAPIYEQVPLEGAVLDVGGSTGSAVRQAALDASRYVCIDPHRLDVEDIRRRFPRYAARYAEGFAAPRLVGRAEALPFIDESFDTVHMRSVIDHLEDPALGLSEAARVLRPGGKIVLGTALEGWYKEGPGVRAKAVRAVKRRPWLESVARRVTGRVDPHIFHPTREAVLGLLADAGFAVHREVWQPAYHNVLYVDARRPIGS